LVSFEDRDILSAVIEENISPNNFSKSFHKLPKKWKAKSEMGGQIFVNFLFSSVNLVVKSS
jgi:hypothetical protein